MTAPRRWFIGCATDRRFVEPTAVMLTSVDMNGEVPDATVLVAAFDLTEADKVRLRVGAGRLAGWIQFIDVSRDMFHEVDPSGFTDFYPPAVLGRLMLSDFITVAGARLLTLDSDMIVNASLRPLFELEMCGEYFAAIHDPPRKDDLTYFNSGLTLCDVDMYKYNKVGRRSLRYVAEHKPYFPDQDALNHVIGASWYRLDQLWNYFCKDRPDFGPEDYEAAKVAHFPSWKPWDYPHHPGRDLYMRYLAYYLDRLERAREGGATRPFSSDPWDER